MILAAVATLTFYQSAKVEITDTTVGKGAAAQVGDVVTVDYTGKLTNGKQFDSSVGKKPFTFQLGVGQVIKGWDQGVAGMKEGGVRQLTIPAALGYGEAGAGEDIPGNSTLKFEVKLIKVEPRVQSTILEKGTGPQAQVNDLVSLNIKFGPKDGKDVFDNKVQTPGHTVDFALNGRMRLSGLLQGLLGMQQGEKRKIIVPPPLGYGDRMIPPVDQGGQKAGSILPANSTLVFVVELVKLVPGGGK